MTYRPQEWQDMTPTQKRRWVKKHSTITTTRRRKRLGPKDKGQVWALMQIHRNKSLVGELMGVHRRTIIRFLERFPIPETFKLLDDIEGFEEIKMWKHRQRAFCKASVLRTYLVMLRKMYNYMKEHHPDRARPRLWTSDHILEFVQTFEESQQHNPLVACRQLALKCPKLFLLIDLGLLPTRRTHKAKRSLAGKEEYYFDIDPDNGINQVQDMIDNVPNGDATIEARNESIIAVLFNTACRTGDARKGRGLCGIKIEGMHLSKHNMQMKDKHDITWNVLGLSNDTVTYLRKYLELRGTPTRGFLFVNENGHPMRASEVNGVIKEAGENAGIEGKNLTAKSFRKTFVKYALEVCDMNPVSLIGTGKNVKTCFCVGWTDMKVLMEYYAPKLTKQIEEDREKFAM